MIELAEEVIRLRALLMACGQASDVTETLKLERLSQVEEENIRLQRQVSTWFVVRFQDFLHAFPLQVEYLTARVHDLERAQTEAEFSAEVGEERYFNRHRAESPHAVSGPIAISPHLARRSGGSYHAGGPPQTMVPALSTSPSWAIPRPSLHHYVGDDSRTRSNSDASMSVKAGTLERFWSKYNFSLSNFRNSTASGTSAH